MTSVIMCTRNRKHEFMRFTNSLAVQTQPPQEYIVVDSSDNSLNTDPDFQTLIDSLDGIKVVYIHSKPGLTLQRNIGIKTAEGEVLYFFDDDIVLDPFFLENMNKVFKKYPYFMGGMGKITNEEGQSDGRWLPFREELYSLLCRFFFLQNGKSDGTFTLAGFSNNPCYTDKFIETEVLSGGITAYRKQVFQEFTFDEQLTGYSAMEDQDFSRRVSYKYKLFFQPESRCLHLHGKGGREGNITRHRKQIMVNFRYFFFKNFYPHNRYSLLAHYWAIFGLFVQSAMFLLFRPKQEFQTLKGYFQGLREFAKRREELLGNK